MSATTDYIAASTNRFNHAADVSTSTNLAAFASGKLIALWQTDDPADRGVLKTLPGHAGLVTCVRFIDGVTLLTADDAGVLKLWRNSTPAISALAIHHGTRCVLTGGSDAVVKVWELEEQDGLKEVQTISLKNRYPLSIEVATLPESEALILAIGSTDRSIQIYTRSESTFLLSATLSGHEDWVRSLAFRPFAASTSSTNISPLILASGSQDATIRLWNIEPVRQEKPAPTEAAPLSDELLDAFEASLADAGESGEGGRQISLKKHVLTIKRTDGSPRQFSITFDALLVGHEAGVTSLSWRPSIPLTEPTLLSTSTDSSLILWSPSSLAIPSQDGTDGNASLWINRQRFGDVGGQRLGGFVGGLWASRGNEAMAWGWSGGWRRWRCEAPATVEGGAPDTDVEKEVWTEVGAISGHAGPVKGISWAPGVSDPRRSLDQTTRIHGPVPASETHPACSWHELARPQVHGYDLLGVAALDALRFASVADEKVARVFEAPRGFVATLKGLGVADLGVDEEARPVSASVPPLGLSNKAVGGGDGDPRLYAGVIRRPFEGELAAMTLWPEVEKVFGHGYESITIAASTSRNLIATACKATTPKHAVVRLYDTKKFQPVGEPLAGHALTVTRIAFSPDDRRVLTVSRDRTWRLFELQETEGAAGYVPIAADKSHARIIWDCAWSPNGRLFATASRDKTVRIWHTKDDAKLQWTTAATLKLHEAATAVAFQPIAKEESILAVGLETGEIIIYTSSSDTEWHLSLTINKEAAHVDHIHQLAWRPGKDADQKQWQIASCSEDGTSRILTVTVP
ncbi:WD40 repeat-like protein [Dentipellis sp. KUC8613]|nr:WD40 repeat-like protein [Dentipellis sp. KUC8613]